MTDYSARMQGHLPARLAESPALSPVTGGVQGELAAQLQELGDASVALSGALRNVDYTVPHDQLLIRALAPLAAGGTVYDFETETTATISAVTAYDSETPATWQYTLTDLTGPIYLGDNISVPDELGPVYGTALADLFPVANGFLAGIARIVGRRRGLTDPDDLTRAAILAQVASNVTWGRVADMLTAAVALFPGGVYLDDGGETSSDSSAWGTGHVDNGQVLLEAATIEDVPELTYSMLSRLVRQAAPAGVQVLIGALRGRGLVPFTFGTNAFGDGSVFYSLE